MPGGWWCVQILADVFKGIVVAQLELQLRGGKEAGFVHRNGHRAGDDVVVSLQCIEVEVLANRHCARTECSGEQGGPNLEAEKVGLHVVDDVALAINEDVLLKNELAGHVDALVLEHGLLDFLES
jgi:hypothetical protein